MARAGVANLEARMDIRGLVGALLPAFLVLALRYLAGIAVASTPNHVT
jgi:hypothetical protein